MTANARKPIAIPAILGIPLLLIVAVFSIPYAIVAGLCIAAREWRLFRRLATAHRTLPWSEVERHLRSGSGTLIIEQAQKQSRRLWWTPDDIPSLSPTPVPALENIDFVFFEPAAPFATWCFEHYLSPSTGTAFLTRSVGLFLPRGFILPDFFTDRFPSARVIATTLTSAPSK